MKLSAYLEAKNIKPAQFAEKIGKHRSSVLRFCDETRRPDLATLEKIHDATNGEVTATDFFRGSSATSAAKRKRKKPSMSIRKSPPEQA